MNGRDLDDSSFDPRSWGRDGENRAPATRIAPTEAETTSFDPSTWGKATDSAAPEQPAPISVATPDPDKRRYLIAAGSGLLILLTGGMAAYMGASDVTPPVATAASIAEQPVPAGHSRRTFSVTGPEMILTSLTDMGIDQQSAAAAAQQVLAVIGSTPGELRVDAQLAPGEAGGMTLAALEVTRSDGSGVTLAAAADGSLAATKLDSRLETQIVSARGEMDTNSFYSSAVTAGINDAVISDFAAAFSFDVDFQWEVQPGDIFEAAFEQAYNPAGEAVGVPRLLFASLRLENKSLRLYRFKPPGQSEFGWFDANGRSNVRSLMRTPVDGARVSSRFGYRIHPIQGFKKLHRGTDFAAPTGTPVYASGSATVVSASFAGGAGNLVQLRHEKDGWLTKYMHLSAFAPGMTPGAKVAQGQKIGEVGSTGASTGPHLHYEVWVDGEPVDSQSIDTGTGVTLEGASLDAFKRERDRIDLARSQRVE